MPQAAQPIAIGTVAELTGTAQAQNPATGEVRDLNVGDMVYAHEVIITSDGSNIVLSMGDGSNLAIGEGSELALNAQGIGGERFSSLTQEAAEDAGQGAVPSVEAIGTVVALSGNAEAKNPVTGETRVLKIGDQVFADEIVITADGSAIAIEFKDGSRLDLGRNSEIALDTEVFNPSILATLDLPGTTAQSSQDQLLDALINDSATDIDAIQQALLAGEDPSQLEATAAGPGTGGGGEEEGSSFVILERSGQQTTPDSGFNTDPIAPEFTPVDPEDPPVEEEAAPPGENFGVTVTGDVGTVSENGLSGVPSQYGTTHQGQFTITAPDGVGLAQLNPQFISDDGLTADNFKDFGPYSIRFDDFDPDTGVVSYTFTLEEALDHAAGEPIVLEFQINVEDSDGDVSEEPGILTINVLDGVPLATADIGNISEGGTLIVDADNGVLNNDQSRADGYDATGAVVGVVTGSDNDTDTEEPASVGDEIQGAYGKLTLNADGSYQYVSTADTITGDEQDVFVYTIRDADGDLDSATLTINVADVTVRPQNASGEVSEAGLDNGSDPQPSDSDLVVGGSLNLSGLTAQADSGSTSLGSWEVFENGTFNYTLNTNTQDVDNQPETDSFSYTATDANGNSVVNTVTITITDDGPSVTVSATSEGAVTLTTQDADTIGAASDTDVTTANFSGVFSNAPVYGADGAGTTTMSYALSLATGVNNGDDSGLDSNGASVNLYNLAGIIVGATGAAPTSATDANVVFSLAVDGTGIVTLTQHQEIDHSTSDTAGYDSDLETLASDLVNLTATALTTDGDGDTATHSATIDLGGNVRFADDGPSVTVSATSEGAVTLTTQDADTIGAASDTDVTTANFSGVFSNTPDYGADGAGTTTMSYALSLATGVNNGDDSGLDSNGASVNLYNLAGIIVGATGAAPTSATDANVVFSLAVDGTGIVTLTQHQEIDHSTSDTAGYDSDLETLASDLVNLTATALTTDGDGDTATNSATIDLGGNVRFADDGPSVTVSATSEGAVTLTTQDADTIGAASDTDVTTANFSGVFSNTPDYGADGAGTTTMSYALSLATGVNNGDDSGLDSNGASVNLYNLAGIIVGATGAAPTSATDANVVFSLAVDGTGIVTLTQHQEIDHSTSDTAGYDSDLETLASDLVNLTATALTTDGDGDTATNSATIDLGGNVRFADDGPSVTVSATSEGAVTLTTQDADTIGAASDTDVTTANFSGVFSNTPDYGADGAGTTTMSYALSLATGVNNGDDSGLDSNGASVNLYNLAGIIVGATGAAPTSATDANVVFSLAVDGTGIVTLTQHQEIDHSTSDTAGYDSDLETLASDLVNLTATALTTDGDGDTATNSATIDLGGNVRFADDGPSVTVSATSEGAVTLTTQDADTIGAASDTDVTTANFSGVFSNTPDYGADGAGTTTMSYALSLATGVNNGDDSGLDSNGASVNLYNLAGIIVGATGAAPTSATDANVVFSLAVDGTGIVTLTQHQEIDHSTSDTAGYDSDLETLASDLVNLTATALTTDGDGDTATNSATIDLGGNVRFADDGPSVTVSATSEGAVTLTTQDADTIGAASDTDVTTANFSGVFSNTPDYGADGAGTTTMSYALSLATGVNNGDDSGLDSNGASVNLYNLAGIIVGATGAAPTSATDANVVFSLAVDGTGIVTLTQHQEIDHSTSDTAGYDSDLETLASDLVNLTATALTTDGDGDTATNSATIDLGGNVRFADDGPSVTVSATSEGAVTLTTQDADTIGAASDTDVTTANFSGVFSNTPDYGADGAGTTTMSYALSLATGVNNGDDSGLDSNGASVNLYNLAGIIVGATGAAPTSATDANVVFSLAVDGTGIVTLTQHQEIDHSTSDTAGYDSDLETLASDLVNLTATALTTDGDGDTATNSATIDLGGNVRFADDGPSVTVSATSEGAVTLTTQDADTIGAASDTDVTTANFSGVFSNTPDYGADGAGTTTMSYALSLATGVNNGDDSGLDSNGASVNLYNLAGIIVGATGAAPTSATDANVVFSLAVDGTGIVTLTQHQEIDHSTSDTAGYDSDLETLASDLVNLTATALTTDGDGDTATNSATIDLGGNVRFADDGPSVTVSATSEGAVTLTTQDADTIGAASDTDVTTANFSGVFSNTPDYGADGAGTTTMSYALSLATGVNNGDDSGLDSNGASVNLYNLAGIIVGATGAAPTSATDANVVFSLAVDGTGIVTLTQHQEIDHSTSDTAGYDSDLETLASDLVNLTATALTTDGDGDTATNSATIDLGGNVRFADDGPSVTVSATSEGAVTLTTQDADTIGAASDTDVTTANFSGVFSNTPDYGADGAGTTTMSYALSLATGVNNGDDSGLDSNGASVNLYNLAGIIVGATGAAPTSATDANVVFSLAVDGTGIVTLTQHQEIDHSTSDTAGYDSDLETLASDLVNLTATALTTDGDGDTATNSATIDLGGNVRFADDGPSVTVSATSEGAVTLTTQDADTIGAASDTDVTTANFSGVFSNTPDYGADGAGTTTMSYALSLATGVNNGDDSGLDSNGASVNLYNLAGIIVGATGAAPTSATDANVVFSLAVDGTGIVTLTQHQEIDHSTSDTAGYDSDLETLASDLVNLTATALTTDGDGDTATNSATIDLGGNVRFADDGPSVTVSATSEGAVTLTTQDADTIGAASDTDVTTANFSGVFSNTPDYGADGAGTTTMSYALSLATGVNNGDDSGLDSNGASVNLYNLAGIIVGATGAAPTSATDANVVFSLAVDGTGIVTLTQHQEIDHSTSDTAGYDSDLETLASDLVNLTATALTTDGDGDTATNSATIDLGGNVRFADDGPSVTVSATSEGAVTLTTQDADTIGAASDTDVTTANFSGVFSNTPDYGADGAGTTTMSYALSLATGVNNGDDSGLDSNGASVNLYNLAGIIVGATGAAPTSATDANVVFSLAVDGTGIVTLTQHQEIDHSTSDTAGYDSDLETLASDLVNLTATALTTDGDGDTATNSATIDLGGNVRFADDGPSVTVSATSEGAVTLTTQDADTIGAASDTDVTTANFSGVFSNTPDYGADGAGTTTMSYALSLATGVNNGDDSGLDSNGASVNLYNLAGIIVGATGAAPTSATDANVVFSLAVDGTGIVTLTQHQEIDHSTSDTAGYDSDLETLASDLVNLTATALTTDGDGDTATHSATIDLGGNVRFADDGPSVTAKTNLIFANEGTMPTGSGVFDYNVGADRNDYNNSSDFLAMALTGTVGLAGIQTPTISLASEDGSEAVFNFSFQYAPNPNDEETLTDAEGTLTFNKTDGTYTVTIDPIESFTVLTTSGTLSQENYDLPNVTGDPNIVVSKLDDDFFVRFTGSSGNLQDTGNNGYDGSANDTFSGTQSYLSISGTQNGIGSDTIQGKHGEALTLDFYTTSPGGNPTPAPGDARATGMYLKVAQVGGTEDMVVLLKLVDPDDGSMITKAIVVGREDFWMFNESNPYNVPMAQSGPAEGLVIIESNDYNSGSENYVIYGAQILASTFGITGSGINLNRDTGDTGGSSTTQAFSTDKGNVTTGTADSDVLKIVDIGIISAQTSTADADLQFQFDLQDGDGDTTGTQQLNVSIVSGSVFTGTADADSIQGSSGNDYIDGGLGNDVINSGDGNDVIAYDALDTIDGGDGMDILVVKVDGSTNLGGLTMPSTSDGTSIEGVGLDMTNGATDTLSLDAGDVLDLGESGTLFVTGDSGDEVELTGSSWAQAGTSSVDGYSEWAGVDSLSNSVTVYIETGIAVSTPDVV